MIKNLDPIRNFTIISHIDHGKSTLADRFLEITKTIPKGKLIEQYLDKMSLEREKGITIKMHPCRMLFNIGSKKSYILNLIDTPGHVDFSYEVSRALAAVEGAILLVDVTKGIQAQTIANLELAKKENLAIIPAVNKIDLSFHERIEEVKKEIADLLNLPSSKILSISAKKGIGIQKLLSQIIKKVPPPPNPESTSFRALIFDSKYDSFQGVVAYIRVFEGKIKKGDKIFLARKKVEGIAKEIGYFSPELIIKEELSAGEIGYIKTGIREPEKVRVGDTVLSLGSRPQDLKLSSAIPLPGYEEPQPVVFTSLFLQQSSTFKALKEALQELHLSDPSFTFQEIQKRIVQDQISRGFQCGFLGLLHMEIILERLKREFSLSVFIARPTVSYEIINREKEKQIISSAQDWPDSSKILLIREPWAEVEIITPQEYFNNIIKLFPIFKINFISSNSFGKEKSKIKCEMPFRKLIESFYDKLKSVSQGFASMSFHVKDYKLADLVRLDILVAKEKEYSLSKIVEKQESQKEGKKMVERLKELFPKQLFSVAIQAAVEGRVIARENIKALRKDVTAPLYGGDITRKMKLLQKQKKGKKRLEDKGKIILPKEVIIELIKE